MMICDDDGDDDDDPFQTGLACFAKWSLMPSTRMNCYAYVSMIMIIIMIVMMMMMTMTTMTTIAIVIAIAMAMTCYDLPFFCQVKSDARQPWRGLTFET